MGEGNSRGVNVYTILNQSKRDKAEGLNAIFALGNLKALLKQNL